MECVRLGWNKDRGLHFDVRYWHKADMACCAAHVRF
jgi:hypothetical protein